MNICRHIRLYAIHKKICKQCTFSNPNKMSSDSIIPFYPSPRHQSLYVSALIGQLNQYADFQPKASRAFAYFFFNGVIVVTNGGWCGLMMAVECVGIRTTKTIAVKGLIKNIKRT